MQTALPRARAAQIAVIVPAYGVAHLVGEALDSLLAQGFEDWECVVIDDGAPDDVAGAVEPYLGDARIRFLATGNHGVSAARNTAIANTTAPFIALLDGDDLFRPAHLEKMVAALRGDPVARIVTCNSRIFGAVPRERLSVDRRQGTSDGYHGSLADVLSRSFNVYIGSSFRRVDFDRVGGFDVEMAHAEDFDFWVRLMALGGHALYLDEVLGDYRVRAGSASADSPRIYSGNIRTYSKLLDARPDAPEAELLRELIAENEQLLALECAIEQVIAGETRAGLAVLRQHSDAVQGLSWKVSFILWRAFPALARPMLAWRQRSHARGAINPSLLQLLWNREMA